MPALTVSPHDLLQAVPSHQQPIHRQTPVRLQHLFTVVLDNHTTVDLGQTLDLNTRNGPLQQLEPRVRSAAFPAILGTRHVDVNTQTSFIIVERDGPSRDLEFGRHDDRVFDRAERDFELSHQPHCIVPCRHACPTQG